MTPDEEIAHLWAEHTRQREQIAALTAGAVDILGDSLPGGRYYLAARLQRAEQSALLLSAGEAELRRK